MSYVEDYWKSAPLYLQAFLLSQRTLVTMSASPTNNRTTSYSEGTWHLLFCAAYPLWRLARYLRRQSRHSWGWHIHIFKSESARYIKIILRSLDGLLPIWERDGEGHGCWWQESGSWKLKGCFEVGVRGKNASILYPASCLSFWSRVSVYVIGFS